MPSIERIGDLLVRRGLLSREVVENIARESANSSMRFASLAVDHWHVDERAMLQILAERCGIPGIEVDKVILQPAACAKVPLAMARRYSVLPVALQGEQLRLAMADPLDEEVRRDVEAGTRCAVLPYIALHGRIRARLDANYQRIAAMPPTSDAELAALPVVTGSVPSPLSLSLPDTPDESNIVGEPTEAMVGSSDIVVVAHAEAQQRREIFAALGPTRCTLLAAADGRTALNLVKEHRPRLVILAAMLPFVDGYEICRRMKASRRFGGIPALLIGKPPKSWQHTAGQGAYGADKIIDAPVAISEVAKVASRLLAKTPADASMPVLQEQFDTAYFAGIEALDAGSMPTALEHFRRAESIDPLSAKTQCMLGRAYAENNEPLKAIYHFERAVILDPRLFVALKQLAQLYQLHGFRQKANDTWRQAIQASPTPDVRRQISIYLDAIAKDA